MNFKVGDKVRLKPVELMANFDQSSQKQLLDKYGANEFIISSMDIGMLQCKDISHWFSHIRFEKVESTPIKEDKDPMETLEVGDIVRFKRDNNNLNEIARHTFIICFDEQIVTNLISGNRGPRTCIKTDKHPFGFFANRYEFIRKGNKNTMKQQDIDKKIAAKWAPIMCDFHPKDKIKYIGNKECFQGMQGQVSLKGAYMKGGLVHVEIIWSGYKNLRSAMTPADLEMVAKAPPKPVRGPNYYLGCC